MGCDTNDGGQPLMPNDRHDFKFHNGRGEPEAGGRKPEGGREGKVEAPRRKDERRVYRLEKSRVRTVETITQAVTRDSPIRNEKGGVRMCVGRN